MTDAALPAVEALLAIANHRDAQSRRAEECLASWSLFLERADKAPDAVTAEICRGYAESNKQKAVRAQRVCEALSWALGVLDQVEGMPSLPSAPRAISTITSAKEQRHVFTQA